MPCWSLAGSPQSATVPFKGWSFSAKFCYAGTIHTGVVCHYVWPHVCIYVEIFRWGLRGHEEIDLHLRVVLSSKKLSFGVAIRWDKDVRQWEKTKDERNTRFFVSRVFRYGKQMKAVNSWKSQGQQRRWFQKKERSSTLPAPQNLARKRNIPKLQRLKIIKIYKTSESISFVGFKFPEGSGCRPNLSLRKHVGVSICDSICVVLWKEHTSTEATIPSLNYARTIILTANCVAGQSSPHHRKECGELGDQHKATNLFEWSGFCGKDQSVGKISFIDVWPPQVETWMTEVENQMLAAIREAPHQRQNGDTISLHLVGDWRFYMILDVHEFMVMSYDWCYVLLPGTVPQEIIIDNYEAWSPFGHLAWQFLLWDCRSSKLVLRATSRRQERTGPRSWNFKNCSMNM